MRWSSPLAAFRNGIRRSSAPAHPHAHRSPAGERGRRIARGARRRGDADTALRRRVLDAGVDRPRRAGTIRSVSWPPRPRQARRHPRESSRPALRQRGGLVSPRRARAMFAQHAAAGRCRLPRLRSRLHRPLRTGPREAGVVPACTLPREWIPEARQDRWPTSPSRSGSTRAGLPRRSRVTTNLPIRGATSTSARTTPFNHFNGDERGQPNACLLLSRNRRSTRSK